MKFRYYITRLHTGSILGTDVESVAVSYASDSDCFVVDAETGEWIQEELNREPVEAAEK